MMLSKSKNYFVSKSHVHLRNTAKGSKKINHLLLGDWLRVLDINPQHGSAYVKCRGDKGWLKLEEFSERRALEINFVDIGQGDGCHIVTPDDKIILIDAGVGSNMNRFLSWRYNLRYRNVERANDFDEAEGKVKKPWLIDHVVISHPDNDHYYGLSDVFKNKKLQFKKIYHNGIVERPESTKEDGVFYHDDLGGYVKIGSKKYLWDIIDSNDKMKVFLAKHPETRKQYISTMREALANSEGVTFQALSVDQDRLDTTTYMNSFNESASMSLQILGPILEGFTYNDIPIKSLRKLGNEGVTKNGHSVILKLTYNNLSVMLGGDLNTQSQDFLLQEYTSVKTKTSTLEKRIKKLMAKGALLSEKEKKALKAAQTKIESIINEARAVFECDVTKACHHGSSHFSDTFLQAINATATIISSGDNESHSHPRPDALGAFGKYSRGVRPLIFSTELARSTKEFTPIIKHFETLQHYQEKISNAPDKETRRKLEKEMENEQDRNVAVYGMITLRALDDQVIIAQKLEAKKKSRKWDIYELHYNEYLNQFELDSH